MTPEQLDLVESSVGPLGPRLDDVVAAFYDRLFTLDPDVRQLFSSDLTEQRTKFASELAFIITLIRRHGSFLATADDLGLRHGRSGVRPDHFRTAGVALLDALAATLGPAWTPELAAAWRLAYRLTSEAMMTGAARTPHR